MKNTMVRMIAAVALAGAAGSALALATAGAASAAPSMPGAPQPVSSRLTAVKANTPSWVNIFWRTGRPVCDVKVSVDGGREVAIAYAGMRRSTTFTTGDSLRPGRTGVTPIRVTAIRRDSGVALLRTTMSYTDCGKRARTQFTRATLALPVIQHVRPGQHQMPPAHHQIPQLPNQHQGPNQHQAPQLPNQHQNPQNQHQAPQHPAKR
ncbi:hypothetical protein [Paractinoplanes durhamensis]|uniref:Uncharacterized protein n=1 Tax=Paractinoplanes durhamensis TaxID=113563 RepID=A0ABQ3Z878_9ACTN|nr:hypothetical protein [Actinoplanes durhamensis]GIE06023.1 hypothetical protein Adu01nite_73730 [Actinoplanes durhamensis]